MTKEIPYKYGFDETECWYADNVLRVLYRSKKINADEIKEFLRGDYPHLTPKLIKLYKDTQIKNVKDHIFDMYETLVPYMPIVLSKENNQGYKQ